MIKVIKFSKWRRDLALTQLFATITALIAGGCFVLMFFTQGFWCWLFAVLSVGALIDHLSLMDSSVRKAWLVVDYIERK